MKTRTDSRPTHGHGPDEYREGQLEVLTTLNNVATQLAHTVQSLNAVRLRGQRYYPIKVAFAANGAYERISTSGCEFLGYSLLNTDPVNAVTVVFFDGEDAVNGDPVASLVIPAGQDRTIKWDKGLGITRGLVLARQAGVGALAVTGTVYLSQT